MTLKFFGGTYQSPRRRLLRGLTGATPPPLEKNDEEPFEIHDDGPRARFAGRPLGERDGAERRRQPGRRQQRGGGGGGGASTQRHGGSFNLTFDRVGTSAGSRATCLGGYNYTTYVTTLSLDYKLNNCSLTDGTVVYATVYSTDYYTGLPWAPMSAGGITVLGGKATFHNPNVLTTGVFGLPVPTQIVLTLADGTVLFNGHP